MKKDYTVRVTNNVTGEVWERTWHKCSSKYQAIKRMTRQLNRLTRYGVDYQHVDVWEADND